MRGSGLRSICFLDLVEAPPFATGSPVDVAAGGGLIEFVTTTIALFGLRVAVADTAFADPPSAGFTWYPFITGIPVVRKSTL